MTEVAGDLPIAFTAWPFVDDHAAEERRVRDGEYEDTSGTQRRRDVASGRMTSAGIPE